MTINTTERRFPWFCRHLFNHDRMEFYQWRLDHVADCHNSRDTLTYLLEVCLSNNHHDKARIVRSMVRDLKHAEEWLSRLGEPEEVTDWGEQSYDKRSKPVDPDQVAYIVDKKANQVDGRMGSFMVDDFEGRLTDQQREVFRMKVLGCLTDKEIAEYLGTSDGNVYNIRQAIEKKRKKFVREYENSLIL